MREEARAEGSDWEVAERASSPGPGWTYIGTGKAKKLEFTQILVSFQLFSPLVLPQFRQSILGPYLREKRSPERLISRRFPPSLGSLPRCHACLSLPLVNQHVSVTKRMPHAHLFSSLLFPPCSLARCLHAPADGRTANDVQALQRRGGAVFYLTS